MAYEKDTGALVNQISVVTRDHIDWIKTQLLKPDNFMKAKGREVWIDVPNSKLKNIVTIPGKGEANYRDAWVKVYNLAVDYLEDSLSFACMNGELDYRTIKWPMFNAESADYARELEIIFDAYKLKLRHEKEMALNDEPTVTKRSVILTPKEIPDTKEDEQEVLDVTPKEPEVKEINEKPFVVKKLLDGDKLTKKDINDLQETNTNMVILPCQNINNIKEEKLFLENMQMCEEENIKTGAMVYGKATDEKDASYELKKIFKLLEQCGPKFTKMVIYEVNDKFVFDHKGSEMELLSFINAYSLIAEGLAKEGCLPVISMNLMSKKFLEDIYQRYNLESKYEIVYVVLVREIEELEKNDSTILMDPQYDYDILTLKNPKYSTGSELKEVINNLEKNTTLAKAA